MSITFARFNSHAAAQAASKLIQHQLGHLGRVQVLSGAQRLSNLVLPPSMTAARSGAMLGGAFAGLLSTVAIGAFLLLGMPWSPIPAPLPTMGICVAFSTLLGCLGGALCYVPNSNATAQQLRDWLREGQSVVIIETHQEHEQAMPLRAADPVGELG
jgi:hypothetical protein